MMEELLEESQVYDRDFHRGETSDDLLAYPNAVAKSVLVHREDSVRGYVTSFAELVHGINSLGDDHGRLSKMWGLLAKRKFIPDSEAIQGPPNATLSKYRTISKYSAVLLNERIIGLLKPSYSGFYALSLYYKELTSDGTSPASLEGRIELLQSKLIGMSGPISRKTLESETNRLKQSKQEEGRSPSDEDEDPVDHTKANHSSVAEESELELCPVEQYPKQTADDGSPYDRPKATDLIEAVVQRDAEQVEKNGTNVGGACGGDTNGEATAAVLPTRSHEVPLVSELVELVFPADSIGDEAALIIQGSLSSLLPIRNTLLKSVAASNIHLLAKGTSTGWERIVCDSEAGDLK